MRVTCKNCGGAHPTYDCKRPKKPASAVETSAPADGGRKTKTDASAPKSQTKSTAARKDVRNGGQRSKGAALEAEVPVRVRPDPIDVSAGTQALTVDTPSDIRKPGRPKTGFDKAAYNREFMRKRRAAAKAAVKP